MQSPYQCAPLQNALPNLDLSKYGSIQSLLQHSRLSDTPHLLSRGAQRPLLPPNPNRIFHAAHPPKKRLVHPEEQAIIQSNVPLCDHSKFIPRIEPRPWDQPLFAEPPLRSDHPATSATTLKRKRAEANLESDYPYQDSDWEAQDLRDVFHLHVPGEFALPAERKATAAEYHHYYRSDRLVPFQPFVSEEYRRDRKALAILFEQQAAAEEFASKIVNLSTLASRPVRRLHKSLNNSVIAAAHLIIRTYRYGAVHSAPAKRRCCQAVKVCRKLRNSVLNAVARVLRPVVAAVSCSAERFAISAGSQCLFNDLKDVCHFAHRPTWELLDTERWSRAVPSQTLLSRDQSERIAPPSLLSAPTDNTTSSIVAPSSKAQLDPLNLVAQTTVSSRFPPDPAPLEAKPGLGPFVAVPTVRRAERGVRKRKSPQDSYGSNSAAKRQQCHNFNPQSKSPACSTTITGASYPVSTDQIVRTLNSVATIAMETPQKSTDPAQVSFLGQMSGFAASRFTAAINFLFPTPIAASSSQPPREGVYRDIDRATQQFRARRARESQLHAGQRRAERRQQKSTTRRSAVGGSVSTRSGTRQHTGLNPSNTNEESLSESQGSSEEEESSSSEDELTSLGFKPSATASEDDATLQQSIGILNLKLHDSPLKTQRTRTDVANRGERYDRFKDLKAGSTFVPIRDYINAPRRPVSEKRLSRRLREQQEQAERDAREAEEVARVARENEEQRIRAERAKLDWQGLLVKPTRPAIAPLNQQWRAKFEAAMQQPAQVELAKDSKGVPITRHSFGTCCPRSNADAGHAWLNDEIINAYLGYVVAYGNGATKDNPRPPLAPGAVPRYGAFNNAFYNNITKNGPASVSRWAKRLGYEGEKLLQAHAVFVPVNTGAHWTMAIIRPMLKRVEYYDSMGDHPGNVFKILDGFLRNHLKSAYNAEEWKYSMPQCPQQSNGSDCGVFAITAAKMLTLGLDPMYSYSSSVMKTQRQQILAELMNQGFTADFLPEDPLAAEMRA